MDGVTVAELQAYLKTHWEQVKTELLAGTYKPALVKRVEIPKPGGGVRLLGIPTVMDRLLQQALFQVMNPIFDAHFSWYSYGFRPGRAHDAVLQAQRYMRDGFRWVVDIDLEKFFDRVRKQWKWVKTRLRELRALGVPEWACFVMANSGRGLWEMSRNINNALPTFYWEAKGLKSMLSRYMELRIPFGTA